MVLGGLGAINTLGGPLSHTQATSARMRVGQQSTFVHAELGLIQLPGKCDSSHVQGEETEAQRSQQLAELTT